VTVLRDTQNDWVFVLRPSSGVLNTREHGVSETGTVHLTAKTNPVSEM
jgi:hypothetical protein